MRTVLVAGLTLALAFLFGANTAAQPPDQPATLSVSTELVQVEVIVKDAHGNPVRGLDQNAFEVYDNGKRQDIRFFNVEDYSPGRASPQPAVAPLPAPSLPAISTFSNRTAGTPNSANPPTVIVIDAGNTWDPSRATWPEMVAARDAVVQFLRQVHPDDRLGIYLMGPQRFWVLREYNQDCADLIERLATWKGSASPGMAKAAGGAKPLDVWTEFALHFILVDAATAQQIHRAQFYSVDPALSGALPQQPDLPAMHTGPDSGASANGASGATAGLILNDHGVFVPQDQSRALPVLTAVAEHLAGIPGRKNLILVSSQAFLPADHIKQNQALRNILRTGVSIYAVDPGGLAPYALDAGFAIPSNVTMNPGNAQQQAQAYMNQKGGQKRFTILALQESLRAMAEETGGQVFLNSNDIARAIGTAFDDSQVSYTLGFYASDSRHDGSYHALKVKVSDGERLTVRARPGYFEPAAPAGDRKGVEAELRAAVWSPVDASLIEVNGEIVPANPAGNAYTLRLRIGTASVSLLPNGGKLSGQLDVSLAQRDSAGNVYDPSSQAIGLNIEDANYPKFLKSGVPYHRDFVPDPKASSLRVIVRDAHTGNIGTLTIPLSRE